MTPIEPVSLGISLLAIIAFITPFVYHSKKRKRQETILRQEFFHAAHEYDLQLHQFEFWRGQYAIGLDESKKILLYLNTAPFREFVRIPLMEVSNISILKASRFKRDGGKKEEIIDRLELQISYWDSQTASARLVFFDGEMHSDMLGEVPLVKKWEKIISPLLGYAVNT